MPCSIQKRGIVMEHTFPKISLRAARVNAEFTQDDVAKRTNKTKQTIVNWENGVTEIKYRDLQMLSDLYEMPIEFLRIPDKRKS